MRVLVVADGSRGDVQPMTVLAQQLQREGHAITMAAPPSFRRFVEEKGLAFAALSFDSEAAIRANPQAAVGGFWATISAAPKIFVATIEAQLEVLPELAKQADFILAGGIHGGVPTAAELAGVPWRWVLYTSTMIPSNDHPPITAPFGRAPRWVNWILWQLTRWLTDRLFRVPVNKHRRRLGLPQISDAAEYMLCANPVLAMEPELAPLPDEWAHADVIGYLDPGEGEPLSEEIEAFLARGETPVYIGFGSMPDLDPQKTTQMFVEATRRAGVRAVISRGWADFGGEMPEHCLLVGPVSHPRMFARVSAIVHHGGAGTTASSTRAGKPQLVVPHIADQFYFGNRVKELGIAVPPVTRPKLTTELLTERLLALKNDSAMRERAAALGEKIRARPRPHDLSRLLVPPANDAPKALPVRISIAPGAPP
ncbi:MAG TPA: glycosyltransferase [Polyangiales bacterium]|nr:glycosyltransferase [Polyangiales bacterium]